MHQDTPIQNGGSDEREKKLARKLKPMHEKRYEILLAQVEQLPREDRDLLLKFDRKITAQELSFGRKSAYLYHLIKLRELLGKPLKKVTREDVERVLANLARAKTKRGKPYRPWTLHNYRVTLKRFYKWLLGKDEEYPPCVKWIKTTQKKSQMPRDSLLTNEEIERLVRACDNPRDRAIFLVQAEGAFRPGELEGMRVGDTRFDQYGVIITVRGKTGDRAVRLVASAPALATWLEHHPNRDDPSAPLWVNIGYKWRGTALTYPGFAGIIRRTKRLAGIKKRVYLYGLRHTSATRLARLLTESELDLYMGWVQGSRMPAVYVHLASRDIDKSMLRIHGLITEEQDRERKFTVIKCPRCTHNNSPGTKLCVKCGLPLTLETAKEIDEKLAMRRALIAKLEKSPKFKELRGLLDELVEEALSK